MSGAPIILASDRSLTQQDPAPCGCKAVSLRFSCGHDYVRIQTCNETTGLHKRNEQHRRTVILKSQDICAECLLTTTSIDNQLFVQVAAGELSERGPPPKNNAPGGYFWNNEGLPDSVCEHDHHLGTQIFEDILNPRRQSIVDPNATVIDHELAESMLYTDAYRLPAVTYDPHAPGNVSIVDRRDENRAFERQNQIASWLEETNEFFDIEPSNEDLLFDWLRSEVLQASEDRKDDKGLVNPISPLQHMDDPYDTSASSCARISDGTIRRYTLGADISPATVDWFIRDEPSTATNHVSSLNAPYANQVLQSIESQSDSWPVVPVIHVTKQGPPPSMFSRIRIPKKSLTKKIKSSISKGYRIVAAKIFIRKGIDGRVLQRQNTVTFRGGSLFSRGGTRADRKAEALRDKMLKRRYAEQGYYQVVASGMSWSDERDKAEGPPWAVTQGVPARDGVMTEGGANSWVTRST